MAEDQSDREMRIGEVILSVLEGKSGTEEEQRDVGSRKCLI